MGGAPFWWILGYDRTPRFLRLRKNPKFSPSVKAFILLSGARTRGSSELATSVDSPQIRTVVAFYIISGRRGRRPLPLARVVGQIFFGCASIPRCRGRRPRRPASWRVRSGKSFSVARASPVVGDGVLDVPCSRRILPRRPAPRRRFFRTSPFFFTYEKSPFYGLFSFFSNFFKIFLKNLLTKHARGCIMCPD